MSPVLPPGIKDIKVTNRKLRLELKPFPANRKSSSLPLVLITPLDAANGLSVVVGVPPVEDKNRKNFMGKVT